MMEKRKIQSSDGKNVARKKLKKAHKQTVLGTKTQHTEPKKGTATGPSTKAPNTDSTAGPQKFAKNFWWHSKKVKTLGRDGTAGAQTTKTAPERKKESIKSGSEKGTETDISKKKKLQLKKKRQRKNRLLSKREKDLGQDAQGDSLRRPKTWEGAKTSSGKQADHEGSESGHNKGKKRASKPSPDHRASRKVTANLAPATSDTGFMASTSPQLQKTGGQKEHIKKKVKKFKKRKNAREVTSSTSEEAAQKPTDAASAVLAAYQVGDSPNSRQKSSSQGKTGLKDTGKAGVESVSSNWKALLPIVEKTKEADAKRRTKFEKGRKRDQQTKPSKPDIWFDDVDPSLVKANENADDDDDVQSETGYNPLIRKDAKDCLTKCLAMDCEMVGTGPNGSQSALARVSIVNQFGACVLDKYVKQREPVTDYRTFVSGIRPRDLREKGEDFEKVQKEVSDMLKGRTVVGHALHNDFKVLYFTQPRNLIRDTSLYQPFRDLFKSKRPGLKKLTELVLKVKVQKGEHNSVEDAQAAMKLYLLHRKQWEKSLREKRHQHQPKSSAKKPSKTSGKETSSAKV